MNVRNSTCWLFLLSLLMVSGCGDEMADASGAPTYQNLIFTHTTRIDAAQDGLAAEPGFSWLATGERVWSSGRREPLNAGTRERANRRTFRASA